MIYDLLLYIFILMIGIFVGFKEISHEGLLKRLDRFQMFALVLILFVMGIRIGADELVLGSIRVLGLKAIAFSLASIGGSVLCVYLLRRILKLDKRGMKR